MSINCYVNFIAVFVEHPHSINAVDGTEVQISCIGINASLVLFEVNGTPASEQSVIDKRFIQLGIENIDSTTKRRNLIATTLIQYNNTMQNSEGTCPAPNISKTVLTLISEYCNSHLYYDILF